jgi:glycosyltransferase involved in cell wall biosynthesis
VEAHARQLVQHLKKSGRDVQVVTKRVSASQSALERVDDVPIHRVAPAGERSAAGKWLTIPFCLAKLASMSNDYDVIVCVDYRGVGIAAVVAGAILGKAVIAQGETAGNLCGPDADSSSGLASESLLARIAKGPARAFYRRADRIVCIGRDLEREALRAGVARERVHYLPHGVDLDRFRPVEASERAAIRRQLHWPEDKTVVLFLGRLSREKGVRDLLDAWKIRRPSNAVLSFVGPDMTGHPWDEGGPGRQFVATNGLADSVRFEGPTDEPRLFYRGADIFVQPSHFEALGNTAIEAMACGLPVITSGVGGLADFCRDNDNSLIYKSGDSQSLASAIERAVSDSPLRARLGASGRRTAERQFDLNTLMAQYEHLIDEAERAR